MGADRFIHKRAGSGDRVNRLNDLEFRFWVFYELGADDFGVMRNDVGAFVETHAYFASVKPAVARAALAGMVRTMDLVRFTAHSLDYLCQRDWQDFQKGEWAQMTTRPKPDDATIATFTPWTQLLFSVWPGQATVPSNPDGRKKRRNSHGVASQSLLSSDNQASESRARANGSGSGVGSGSEKDDLNFTTSEDRAAAFLAGYRERFTKVTGAKFVLVDSPKDFAIARKLVETWDVPRLLDMAEIFFHRDDRQVEGKPKTLPFFAPLASWCDERLRQAGR